MNNLKRIAIICLAVIVTVSFLCYIVMVICTNGIYSYIQQAIKKEIVITDEKDPLFSYNHSNDPKGTAYSKFKFKRKNVWHNFRKGQMTVIFSEDIFDENDAK